MADDIDYYWHRAEVELEHARRATNSIVVLIHHELASAYLGRIAELEQLSMAPLPIDYAVQERRMTACSYYLSIDRHEAQS